MPRERKLTAKAAAALAEKQAKDEKKAKAKGEREQMDDLTSKFGKVGFGPPAAISTGHSMPVDGGRRRRRTRRRKTKRNFFGF
jgi:hypothetical protein